MSITEAAPGPDGGKPAMAQGGGAIHIVEDDALYDIPLLPKAELTKSSRVVYHVWTIVCRCIPAWMVFGMPLVMVGLARPFPQEVFGALTLMTSVFLFSNGIYMAIFSGAATWRMKRAMSA
eukprot:CAMPEP_0198587500 /NCGR_PEP_ID=MMETSP1462-20131121/131936_1 /TAXON_ID=1333877 /ORGANISM="Brandtodinium nutriculum, Strain RCC3387" /LENGTH=120 /DNA_ID=CAMNT_0044318981 /DNA_START=63 /DNA_END=421 /DNA_ORIENTATION=+